MACQVAGAIGGAALANAMFSEPILSASPIGVTAAGPLRLGVKGGFA